MAFQVRYGNMAPESYTSDDWFEFLDSGVLGIHFGNTARSSEYYGAGFWQQVTTDQPPGPQVIPQVF